MMYWNAGLKWGKTVNKENIVMTGADYVRLMGSLNLLFDAVKEMSGVLMSYESVGFISPDSLKMAQDKASKAIELDRYWMRAGVMKHITLPDKKGEA